MKKNEVLNPGEYKYSRPNWDEPIEVEVANDPDGIKEMGVRFKSWQFPVDMRDIPEDAEFEPKKD